MNNKNWFRTAWSRQTLATKLTISYTAAMIVIGAIVGSAAGFVVVIELRRASASAAERAAAATSFAINESVEAYNTSFLLMQVEATARVFAQMDPGRDRDSAIAHVRSQDRGTDGFLFLIDGSGQIVYHPQGTAAGASEENRRAASAIANSDTALLHYVAPERGGTRQLVYHSYSAELPEWGWFLVAAETESSLLGQIPAQTLNRILAGSWPGSVLAAVVLSEDGQLIAESEEWADWSPVALPYLSRSASGVHEIERMFGKRLRHVAYEQTPSFSATIAVVYASDYLEVLLGRFVLLLGGGALVAFVIVTLVSRQTAALVTAPVHRATQHLVGSAATDAAPPEPGDELASLVRGLLRTSVKLSYERRHREEAEHELEITATVYRNVGEGIVIFHPNGAIMRVNPAFTSMTGYSLEEVRGRSPESLTAAGSDENPVENIRESLRQSGEWVGEVEVVRKSDTPIPVLLSIRRVVTPGDETRHYIGVLRDISDIKSTQDRLQHLATHDPLTDLTNRTNLSDSISRTIRTRQRRGGSAAVLFIDVDHFKDVNDAHGHHAGDELLRTVASRLKAAIRAEDLIVRFGGDEFVVVITEFSEITTVDEIVRRMLNRVREPAIVGGITVRPSATAGIAVYPESGTTPEDLLRNADAAMYEAKRVGRGSYRFHDPDINESLRVRLAVQDEIRFSLRTGEFVLLWQPVVRASDSKLVGAEALIRRSRDGDLLSPDTFMPQIEGSRVAIELAAWVLTDTVTTLSAYDEALPEGFRVAVNVSATEILQQDFVPLVLETLRTHSVPNSRLAVEVTEGAAIRDVPTATSVIRGLREAGISVYLDDFGVGYSSLQYLRELGVDAVKLDKSFLTEIPESETSCSFVRGVVELAHGLGLTTIVEGVEREEQLQFLRSTECDIVQGYHTGRPVLVEDFILLLDSDEEEHK